MQNKVLIIAEAGVNHNGDVQLAKKLITEAARAGADIVKFQTWITEELVAPDAPMAEYQKTNDGSESQYQMLKKLELSFEDFRELKRFANKEGIAFLSTPDDFPSLDFLADDLQLPLLKVGSGEITNIPFLRKIGSKNKDVILSTGMSSLADVELAFETLVKAGARSVALLHCTSNYPAPYDSVNLGAMKVLREAFKTRVGYSDHTEGSEVSVAAVALGAEIIEKHFTTDRNLPGPDHKASLDPAELRSLVQQIRNVEEALSGSGRKIIHSTERETRKVVTKGFFAKHPLNAGDVITEEAISVKRPASGIPANFYDMIAGKRLKHSKKTGEAINWSDIDFE